MLSVSCYESGVAAHGFCSAGPELRKSCSVLQKVCSMCGGLGLVQDHGLGQLVCSRQKL